MSLSLPGGIELRLLERQGDLARVETDADTWERLHAAGAFHTDRTQTEGPFEPDRPVRLELVLDPTADDDRDPASWWARSATQTVELPEDLAGDGELREGISFPPPPWLDSLQEAWERFERSDVADEPLLDLITGVFLDQGLDVERPQPDATIVEVQIPDDDVGLWVRTDEGEELVTVFTVLPVEVPPDRVPAVLELAARLNGRVAVGSYEADADRGTLSFKVGIDVRGDRLSVALVRQLVGRALVGAQRARPLLEGVLDGSHTPEGAARRF